MKCLGQTDVNTNSGLSRLTDHRRWGQFIPQPRQGVVVEALMKRERLQLGHRVDKDDDIRPVFNANFERFTHTWPVANTTARGILRRSAIGQTRSSSVMDVLARSHPRHVHFCWCFLVNAHGVQSRHAVEGCYSNMFGELIRVWRDRQARQLREAPHDLPEVLGDGKLQCQGWEDVRSEHCRERDSRRNVVS